MCLIGMRMKCFGYVPAVNKGQGHLGLRALCVHYEADNRSSIDPSHGSIRAFESMILWTGPKAPIPRRSPLKMLQQARLCKHLVTRTRGSRR